MNAMGTKIQQFDVPICTSFKFKARNNQLCYEVDLEKYKQSVNIQNQLENGLVLLLDYNEERQRNEIIYDS